MASPSTPVHPARYLALFLVLLIGVYLLVFLTGDKQAKPKLGIDLQGGTRVTLTARTPDGSRAHPDALNQAQQIISSRVNGLGVSGSEVVIDGDNLVITVPGNDSSEARNLGQTARLYIRPVIHVDSRPAGPAAGRGSQPAAGRAAGRPAGRAAGRAAGAAAASPPGSPGRARASRTGEPGAPAEAPRSNPPTGAPTDTPPAPPVPAGAAPDSAATRADPAPAPAPGQARSSARTWRSASPTRRRCGRAPNSRSRSWRCSSRPRSCNEDDMLAGNDDPNLPLVTCSTDHRRCICSTSRSSAASRSRTPAPGSTSSAASTSSTWSSSRTAAEHLGRLHRRQRRHPDRVHAGLAGRQRPADPGSDSRRPHPDHRTVHRRRGDASWPTSSSTARCRCRSSPRRPKPSRPHWV